MSAAGWTAASSVIARGSIETGVFRAEEVLARHDETYMPKEVQDKIAEAHARGAQQRAAEAEAAGAAGATGTNEAPPEAASQPAAATPDAGDAY